MRRVLIVFSIIIGLLLVTPYLGLDLLSRFVFTNNQSKSEIGESERKLPVNTKNSAIEDKSHYEERQKLLDPPLLSNEDQKPISNSGLAEIEDLLQDR